MSYKKSVNLDKHTEQDGSLVPLEFEDVPFIPKRIFYVKNVPIKTERGGHAHFKTKQFLICVKGIIVVKLHDGFDETEHTLQEDEGIYIPSLIWDSQIFMTGSDILLSLCSTNYDEKDYIDNFNKFKAIRSN